MSAPLHHNMLAVTFEHIPVFHHTPKVPRHITLLPWFADVPGLGLSWRPVFNETEPFTITPGEPITVGAPGREQQARSIASEGLVDLHQRLLELFTRRGVKFANPEWLSGQYTPHYCAEGFDPFDQVDEIVVNEIAVIRNMPYSGKRNYPGRKVTTYERLGSEKPA